MLLAGSVGSESQPSPPPASGLPTWALPSCDSAIALTMARPRPLPPPRRRWRSTAFCFVLPLVVDSVGRVGPEQLRPLPGEQLLERHAVSCVAAEQTMLPSS